MIIALAIVGVVSIVLLLLVRNAKETGELGSQVETYESVLDDIKKANSARNSLNDPDNRDRVRSKYTRQ